MMDAEPQAQKQKTWLARVGYALISASEKQGCWTFLKGWLKWLTFWSVLLYSVALVLLTFILSHVGERNVTTAFLVFLPPAVWLLPALPLAAAALVLHWRALFVLGLTLAWYGYDFMGWRPGGEREAAGEVLRVMSYNRGQHANQSLQPFKNATKPDLLLMQEASNRAAGYAKDPEYAEFTHTQSLGEHTLLSRYPILEAAMLSALPEQSPKAVRFVIDWNGRQVAVYSVHLQTPRSPLQHHSRGAFLYGIIGVPGSPWAESNKKLQSFWDGQIADAELILKAVQEDPLPAIVVGDFNSPHVGYIHRLIARDLGDAHDEVGQGFGWTFPGKTRNPLSAGGPWLRIDYVFYSRHWQALQCITEPDRPSQHRALTATLELKAP
jgi:vancomycin resistance protein VanJ